jgi:hypothetical protein
MEKQTWCEHLDKTSKYTTLKYEFGHKTVLMRIQSWFCPECGVHGAETEVMHSEQIEHEAAG